MLRIAATVLVHFLRLLRVQKYSRKVPGFLLPVCHWTLIVSLVIPFNPFASPDILVNSKKDYDRTSIYIPIFIKPVGLQENQAKKGEKSSAGHESLGNPTSLIAASLNYHSQTSPKQESLEIIAGKNAQVAQNIWTDSEVPPPPAKLLEPPFLRQQRQAYSASEGQLDQLSALESLSDPSQSIQAGLLLELIGPQNGTSGFLDGTGDVNGDGFADILVASHYGSAPTWPYGAWLFLGGNPIDGSVDLFFAGQEASEIGSFGATLAILDDANGDGFSDILIGSQEHGPTPPIGGIAYLYYGGQAVDSTPDLVLDCGGGQGLYCGRTVADAGDVNQDGFSDVLVASGGRYFPDLNQWLENVVLYLGGPLMDSIPDQVYQNPDSTSINFGEILSGIGDVNGDGYGDILIGSPQSTDGRAYIYYGESLPDAEADVILIEQEVSESFVSSVSGVGDLNNDGYDDVIIGAPDSGSGELQSLGRAYVFIGSDSMDGVPDLILTGEHAYQNFGRAVAGDADLNADGVPDILVGAVGKVFAFSGGEAMDAAPEVLLSGTSSFGLALTIVTDFDRSHRAEFVIGTAALSRAYLYEIASEIPSESMLNPCEYDDCVSSYSGATSHVGGPINTATGAYDYVVEDLAFPIVGDTLSFERVYSSFATETYTTTLGYGWTHNQDTRLIFEPSSTQPQTVWFKQNSANRYRFDSAGQDRFTPYPGVFASLEFDPNAQAYLLTDSHSQTVYTFDVEGRIQSKRDANGNALAYSYTGGKLARVSDPTGSRYLEFRYDPLQPERLAAVSDHNGRQVSFGYDPVTGDLTQVTDVLAQTWTYVYDDPTQPHHLTQVIDPRGAVVERTVFDELGRAVRQYNGAGELVVELEYSEAGTVILRDGLGNETLQTYNGRGALWSADAADHSVTSKTYDANFRPITITDPVGNETQYIWSPDGANLNKIRDAAGNTSAFSYDTLNRLTSMTDPLGNKTDYTYSGTLLTGSLDALGNSTQYTYTTPADWPQPEGLLKTVMDPLGNVTQYTYTQFGQLASMTDATGRQTTYRYDDAGRWTVETARERAYWTCYDAAGRGVRSVDNASGAGSTPETHPCRADVYLPSPDPQWDRITTTVYDAVGNLIAVTDADGVTTRTYYDDANRPLFIVQNLDEAAWPVENEAPPLELTGVDKNLITETRYDANGNVYATLQYFLAGSEIKSVATRTYYDAMNRPVLVIRNWVGQELADEHERPTYNPAYPDRNVRTETVYDLRGNVVQTIENDGQVAYSCYNELNQVYKTIRNPSVAEPCSDYTPGAAGDQDVIERTYYDPNGNVIATQDALGRITGSYYDALQRIAYSVQNLTGWNPGDPQLPPLDQLGPRTADQNVITRFVYNPRGEQIAVIDPLGRITRTYYDALGRVKSVVRNWQGEDLFSEQVSDYSPAQPDQNVRTDTLYDPAGGQTIAGVEWLAVDGEIVTRTTRTYYDALDRPALVVENLDPAWDVYAAQAPPCNRDQSGVVSASGGPYNRCSETRYDAAGRAIAKIDALGRVTRSYYDVLGRVATQVRNLTGRPVEDATPPAFTGLEADANLRTDSVYDSSGSLIASLEWTVQDGQATANVTRSYADGLGRAVLVVADLDPGHAYTDPQPPPCSQAAPGAGAPYNVCSTVVYGAGGQVIARRDALGQIERTYYDRLGRPVQVVQNLVGQPVAAETPPAFDPAFPDQNLSTKTLYDRAGRATDTVNGRGVVAHFEYDGLDRLSAVVENYRPGVVADHETNVRTEYGYDANGSRLSILDANGHLTQFTYDDLDRLISEQDALAHTTHYAYNITGQKIRQTDANGAETLYKFDGLGRLVGIDHPKPDADVSFAYDIAGSRIGMQDGLGETQWEVDRLGRVTAVSDPFGQQVEYSLDASGRRVGLTYPDEREVTYRYDPMGLLREVTDWNSHATTYDYDLSGRLVTATLPGGVTTGYSYDAAGRLTALTHQSAGGSLAEYEYSYDPNGNRVSASEEIQQPAAGRAQMRTQTAAQGGLGQSKVQGAAETESLPELSFDLEPGAFLFGQEDGTLEARLRLSAPSRQTVSVVYRTTPGSAEDGLDYLSVDSRLTFQPGEVEKAISVFLLADEEIEDTEYFTIELAEPLNAVLGRLQVSGYIAGQKAPEDEPGQMIPEPMVLVVGTYTGFHEANAGVTDAAGCIARGWMRSDQNPAQRLPFRVIVDGIEVYQGIANQYRPDLIGTCFGGQCGYSVVLPWTAKLLPNVNHVVTVLGQRSDGSWFETSNTNKTLRCNYTTARIQGRKMMGYGPGQSEMPPATSQTVQLSTGQGVVSASGSPYSFDNLPLGSTSVSLSISVPAGYRVGYTLCLNSTNCHSDLPVWASSVQVQLNKNLIDLWWHFDPLPTPTSTPTRTPTQTSAPTATPTATKTATPTNTNTPTYTATPVTPTFTPTPTDTLTPTPTSTDTPTPTPTETSTATPTPTATPTEPPTPSVPGSFHWRYEYDPLDRLTYACSDWDADLESCQGDFYRYSYDSVGNRLAEETQHGTTTYVYDSANRLTSVNGVAYTWDNNGNLLSDGVYTYTYNRANRLVGVSGAGTTAGYRYNELGDRLEETVNGVTKRFTMDLEAGLTQALEDGDHSYLYGLGRIARYGQDGAEYFLGDALGGVRQVVDYSGVVILTQSYEPYGEVASSAGSAASSYGFTGEWTSASTNLLYLRSRYYSLETGRFLTRDTWQGSYTRPLSLHKWNYVEGNPVTFTDPSGKIKKGTEDRKASKIINRLKPKGFEINKDWGENAYYTFARIPIFCGWYEGVWKIRELELIEEAANKLDSVLNGKVYSAIGRITINKIPVNSTAMAPPNLLSLIGNIVYLTDATKTNEEWYKHTFVHEFGHVWDYRTGHRLSEGLIERLNTWACHNDPLRGEEYCVWDPYHDSIAPSSNMVTYPEPPPDTLVGCDNLPPGPQNPNPQCLEIPYSSTYGNGGPFFTGAGAEDWANSLAYYVYDNYLQGVVIGLRPVRRQYVEQQIRGLR